MDLVIDAVQIICNWLAFGCFVYLIILLVKNKPGLVKKRWLVLGFFVFPVLPFLLTGGVVLLVGLALVALVTIGPFWLGYKLWRRDQRGKQQRTETATSP